jgi:hypothetical protein
MEGSLCGVHGTDRSAHSRIGSEPFENQLSKQVTAASSMTHPEVLEGLYSVLSGNHGASQRKKQFGGHVLKR